MQTLAEKQDTPENTSVAPGLGVVWVVQDVPFHRSALVLSRTPPPVDTMS